LHDRSLKTLDDTYKTLSKVDEKKKEQFTQLSFIRRFCKQDMLASDKGMVQLKRAKSAYDKSVNAHTATKGVAEKINRNVGTLIQRYIQSLPPISSDTFFEKLARELRDIVYNYILYIHGMYTVDHHRNFIYKSHLGPFWCESDTFPWEYDLNSVSDDITIEITQLLYSKATLRFSGDNVVNRVLATESRLGTMLRPKDLIRSLEIEILEMC
jgi:hypothetical protein